MGPYSAMVHCARSSSSKRKHSHASYSRGLGREAPHQQNLRIPRIRAGARAASASLDRSGQRGIPGASAGVAILVQLHVLEGVLPVTPHYGDNIGPFEPEQHMESSAVPAPGTDPVYEQLNALDRAAMCYREGLRHIIEECGNDKPRLDHIREAAERAISGADHYLRAAS